MLETSKPINICVDSLETWSLQTEYWDAMLLSWRLWVRFQINKVKETDILDQQQTKKSNRRISYGCIVHQIKVKVKSFWSHGQVIAMSIPSWCQIDAKLIQSKRQAYAKLMPSWCQFGSCQCLANVKSVSSQCKAFGWLSNVGKIDKIVMYSRFNS